MVGANGFEPSTSCSRTSLNYAKSVGLTAFACAFPLLIWATWATRTTKRNLELGSVLYQVFLHASLRVRSTSGLIEQSPSQYKSTAARSEERRVGKECRYRR